HALGTPGLTYGFLHHGSHPMPSRMVTEFSAERLPIAKVSAGAVGSMGLAASGLSSELAPSQAGLQYAHETGRTGMAPISPPGREDLGRPSRIFVAAVIRSPP